MATELGFSGSELFLGIKKAKGFDKLGVSPPDLQPVSPTANISQMVQCFCRMESIPCRKKDTPAAPSLWLSGANPVSSTPRHQNRSKKNRDRKSRGQEGPERDYKERPKGVKGKIL